MKKYVYTWICTESMEINSQVFDNKEEAVNKMEESYNDVVENGDPEFNDWRENDAYASCQGIEWVWKIIEVEM